MAAADTADRRLPASARKLEKARADGQLARSRDLVHLFCLAAVGGLPLAFGAEITGWLRERLARGLAFDAATLADLEALPERLASPGLDLLAVIGVAGGAAMLAAIAGSLALGGWNFTWKPLLPTAEKLNPLAGFGRLFSAHALAEAGKACALALALGGVGALWFHAHAADFAAVLHRPLPAALADAGTLLAQGLGWLLLTISLFAAIDVPLQRLLLRRRLRMSVEEVRAELKETEGHAEVKGRLRRRMREIATRRMLAAVPRADVVVMNPSHYAVALAYDERSMAAPRVIAKGVDRLALRIRDTAAAAGVPVLEAPPLARALHAHARLDGEVPASLFAAVAQVLAWVYGLKAALPGREAPPPVPEVPAGLDPGPGAVAEDEGFDATLAPRRAGGDA